MLLRLAGTLASMDHDSSIPLITAIERLTKLMAAGSSPEWVARQVGAIIVGWADESEMSPGIAQARVTHMWDSFSKDAADLQEHLTNAGGENAQGEAQTRRVLAAMNAAVAALAAARERL